MRHAWPTNTHRPLAKPLAPGQGSHAHLAARYAHFTTRRTDQQCAVIANSRTDTVIRATTAIDAQRDPTQPVEPREIRDNGTSPPASNRFNPDRSVTISRAAISLRSGGEPPHKSARSATDCVTPFRSADDILAKVTRGRAALAKIRK